MKVVRKSVVIHSILDRMIKGTQAGLLLAGHDASYSTALNLLLLAGAFTLSTKPDDKELWELLSGFLDDTKTLEDLKLGESATEIQEILTKRLLGI